MMSEYSLNSMMEANDVNTISQTDSMKLQDDVVQANESRANESQANESQDNESQANESQANESQDDESQANESQNAESEDNDKSEDNIDEFITDGYNYNLRRERRNYVKEIGIYIKKNDCTKLESYCNYEKFKQILAYKNNNVDASYYSRRSGKRYINNNNFLSNIIVAILRLYYNERQKKRVSKPSYTINEKTKAVINTIILDYYDAVGKNKIMINWLIKCKMWGIIDFINKITPINNNDFSPKIITLTEVTELNKINIYMTGDIRSLFRFNKPEFVIEFIENENMFADTQISLEESNFINDTKIIKFMCDENMISTTRKSVRYYHENHNFLLLNFLIENNLINISITDIKSIFKPKKIRVNKRWAYIGKPRHRRRWRRYKAIGYGAIKKRSTGGKNDEILGMTKDSNFKNNIEKYIENVYALGHIIPIQKCTKRLLFSKGMYDVILCLIKKETNTAENMFDRFERRRLFEHCAVNDDLASMKLLIDKKVLMINELHQKDHYLAMSISRNARNITTYMLNELKIKGVNLSPGMIWSRYDLRHNINRLFENLKFMDDFGILTDTFLKYVINFTRSSSIIDKMIDNFGYEITNKDLDTLKFCKIKDFLRFTKDLKFNKKRFIRKLIKTNYAWKLNKNLSFGLFKTLPNSQKLSSEFGLYALKNGNNTFFYNIMKKFGDSINLELLKKKETKNGKVFSVDGFAFFGGLIDYSKDDNIIQTINKVFTPEEIERLLKLTDKYNNLWCKENRLLIEKLGIQLSIDFLRHIIFDEMHYYYKRSDERFLEQIIKMNDGHKNNNDNYKNEVFDVLISNPTCADTLLKIHDNEHDYLKFMTTQKIYEFIVTCFETRTISQCFPVLLEIIKAVITKKLITPYLYTMIRYGHFSLNRRGWWNDGNTIYFDQFCALLRIQNQVTKSDYEKLSEHCNLTDEEKVKLTKIKVNIIDDYVPDNFELSEVITAYIARGKNREENRNLDLDDDDYDDDISYGFGNAVPKEKKMENEIDQALINAAITNYNNIDCIGNKPDIADLDEIDDLVDDLDDMDDLVDDLAVDVNNLNQDKDDESMCQSEDLNRIVDEIMNDIEKEELCCN